VTKAVAILVLGAGIAWSLAQLPVQLLAPLMKALAL
jgi:hypothetical protein